MAGNLTKRIGFAVVAIPAAVGLVWLGGLPLAILLALVGGLGARELFDIAARRGITPARGPGIFGAAAVGPLVWAGLTLPGTGPLLQDAAPYLAAAFIVAVLLAVLRTTRPDAQPLASAAVTVFAVAYCAVLTSFLLVIRHRLHPEQSWPGAWLVFLPLVVIWVCDTAAMFGGKLIGGPKLAPVVSPGKTRSGGVAGLAGAVVAALVFSQAALVPTGVTLGVGQLVLFGLVLGVVGQAGDLVESLFKREAGVKVSSNLIPGHGGILDRFDSLYVTLPVAAGLNRLFGVL